MDYAELESMPAVGEEPAEPVTEPGGLSPELKMLAKEAGFDGAKASALYEFVKACHSSEA